MKPFVLDYGSQKDILFDAMGTATVYRKKTPESDTFYLVSVDKLWYEPVIGFQQYKRPSGISKAHEKRSSGFPKDPKYVYRHKYATTVRGRFGIIKKCMGMLKPFRG